MLGIPTVYERPNAHTACFYESVERECKKLGVALPRNHEHATNVKVLAIEEEEYRLACRILCPSEYAASTFLKRGFNAEQLARHQYGFDETAFYPVTEEDDHPGGLAVLFAGLCAPIKGLHYGLEAWLRSPASRSGTFSIAGTFTPGYAEKLSGMLSHPSIRVLGHRRDLAEIMRRSDIFVAPSVSEGSALVTYEARGSGCVLLASRATGAICNHMRTGLLHDVGDSDTLSRQISMLDADRGFLRALREESLKLVGELTWASAGRRLLEVYNEVLGTAGRRGQ